MRINPISNSNIIFKDKVEKKEPTTSKVPYFAGCPPINGHLHENKCDSFQKSVVKEGSQT